MYKKNLVKTAMLASIISISMSGCGGCGKEEVVSALDTAQEVVASVEDKTVEKAVEDNVITSVDKTTEKKDETPALKEEASEQEESVTENVIAPVDNVEAMTKEEVFNYLDNTPVQQWDVDVVCKALRLDYNWEIPEEYLYLELTPEEDDRLCEAMDDQMNTWLANYHEPGAEELYNQLIAEQNGEYTGPHPTGGSQNVIYDPTPVDTTITTNTRGNVS